jgi:hypothetical protein
MLLSQLMNYDPEGPCACDHVGQLLPDERRLLRYGDCETRWRLPAELSVRITTSRWRAVPPNSPINDTSLLLLLPPDAHNEWQLLSNRSKGSRQLAELRFGCSYFPPPPIIRGASNLFIIEAPST